MASFIPNIVVEVVAVVSGAVISVGIPLILAKLNKISKLYATVFGVEDVDSISGLVGIVETHDGEIEDLREGQKAIKNRIVDLEETINNRRSDTDAD